MSDSPTTPTAAAQEPVSSQCGECKVALGLRGEDRYAKTRYPQKYGLYSHVETPNAVLQFNLNREIVRARGKGGQWPDSREWLKRTAGNDWVYFSTGGYSGAYEAFGEGLLRDPLRFKIPAPYNEVLKATGEFYLPNPPYPSNSILGGEPFGNPAVSRLVTGWHDILLQAVQTCEDGSKEIREFLHGAAANTPDRLRERAGEFHDIIGGRVDVLPPDARHVDYDLIPAPVAEGCLYNCRFCRVKDGKEFRAHSSREINGRIDRLKDFYGPDAANYNSLLLAGNDALHAGGDVLLPAAERAFRAFGIRESYMHGCNLFLFGSVDSLLGADDGLLEALNELRCRCWINVGLESADQHTLDSLGKPLRAADVNSCFRRMLEINEAFENIEVTGNFVMDESLAWSHYQSMLRLVGDPAPQSFGKGAVYLSPLCKTPPSTRTLFEFNQLQALSRLPIYLYIIQRL
jgi:hypothetical protein